MYSPSRSHILRSGYRYTSFVIVLSILAWSVGLPFLLPRAYALQLDTLSDTLSTSRPSSAADHTIRFVTPSGVPADGSTIVIDVPTGFDMSTIGEDDVDIADDGVDLSTALACGLTQAAVSTSSQTITIEICTGGGGAIVANSVVTIEIGQNATSSGTGAHRIVNHASAGSYPLDIGGTMLDSGSTRLVVLDSVQVSGEVETYLDFSITGVNAGGTVNGDLTTLTGTSTATTVPFGTVAPATEYVLAQDVAVTTNAENGYVVTVVADGDLRSSGNATIDSFFDGTAEATPTTWDAPQPVSGLPDTYGHWGITTEDASLSDNDSFGTALYVGNFVDTPREVMYATSSADGTTQHIGATRVGYKLEVSVLQEAAADYQTTLTYVVTPVF